MLPNITFYYVLGVDEHASSEEIHRAFVKAIKLVERINESLVRLLTTAYNQLEDELLRKEYNDYIHNTKTPPFIPGFSYYDILGVDQNCTPEEIKEAYRNTIKGVHEDNGGVHSLGVLVNEANRVLLDSQERAKYDAEIKAHTHQPYYTDVKNEDYDVKVNVSTNHINFGKVAWFETSEESIRFEVFPYLDEVSDIRTVLDSNEKVPDCISIKCSARGDSFIQYEVILNAIDAPYGKSQISVVFYFIMKSDKRIIRKTVNVEYEVEPFTHTDSDIRLENGEYIRIGTYEIDGNQYSSGNFRVNNFGDIVDSEYISFEWRPSQPFWAGIISTRKVGEAMFPIEISFPVKTSMCDAKKSPYKANILVLYRGKPVGKIPVILTVKKVPEPKIQVSPKKLNFGSLYWCENKTIDVRVDNLGDPPKERLRVLAKGINSLSATIENNEDLANFPKLLRVSIDASDLVFGDYKGNVDIFLGKDLVFQLPVLARVGKEGEPKIRITPSAIKQNIKKNEIFSTKIRIENDGPPIPKISIGWGSVDRHCKKPNVVSVHPTDGLPAEIEIVIDTLDCDEVYTNVLIVSIINKGRIIKTEKVPIHLKIN